MSRRRSRGDLLHRAPATTGVELRDRDEQERDRKADERRAVELPEGEPAAVERLRDRDEADRGEDRRDDDAHVERVDDRVLALADAGEERPDHRGEHRHPTERERVEPEVTRRIGRTEQHHGHRGHRVRLEQVGGHAGAVADVVTDVVGDHGGVARVVLGNSGLDLADEVSADVGGLREDAAAEAGEHRDQRATEGEPDEILHGRLRRVAEGTGEEPVVAGDAEQAETDDEQPRDRPGAERDLERGRNALARRLRRAKVRADSDVHADEARRGGEHCPDHEAERRTPTERVVEPDQNDRQDRDNGDPGVLLLQVRGGALLYGTRNLAHPLIALRLFEQPVGQVEPKQHCDTRADEREGHSMVIEEVHQPSGGNVTKKAPKRDRRARLCSTNWLAAWRTAQREPSQPTRSGLSARSP